MQERTGENLEVTDDRTFLRCLHFLSSCFLTSILAYQRPNAKKLRRVAEKAERLAAMGALPRREKLLQLRKTTETRIKEKPLGHKDPARSFYDLWSAGSE